MLTLQISRTSNYYENFFRNSLTDTQILIPCFFDKTESIWLSLTSTVEDFPSSDCVLSLMGWIS